MTRVAACWKVVGLRPEVHPLTGDITEDRRDLGVSEADKAALEWALRLGGEEDTVLISAGSAACEAVLREGVAAGAAVAQRVAVDPGVPSADVAAALATALRDVDVVVCGDWSLDRGSGSVPAYLAAELGATQALGLVALAAGDRPGELTAERRLDGGRRERLTIGAPAVLSVEGGTARLRRAPLPRVRRSVSAPIEVIPGPTTVVASTLRRHGPYRPRPRALPAPAPTLTARERVLALTGALTPRSATERLELEPAAAAAHILDLLETWGYRRPPPGPLV